jgi:DNA-binding SARP family transcriptional activator
LYLHLERHDPRPNRRAPTAVHVTVLGGFQVSVNGVPTPDEGWARRSAAALVKILALAPGHRLHREKVMDLLWPDVSPHRAAPRLHKAAHFARRAAGRHDAVVSQDDLVSLFPGAEVTVDALAFEQFARAAVAHDDVAAARVALSWYGGELLPADPYEDWAADRRELLALRRLDVLRVAGEWRELAELDPTNEEAHTNLMRRHLAAGNGEAALRQFERLERVLDRELGVAPGPEARQASREAERLDQCEGTETPYRVDALIAELADLVRRQTSVLAQLAAAGGSVVLDPLAAVP